MRWSGAVILAFIVYHLLDLTIGAVNPGFVEGRVYRNVVASFQVVPVALFYIVAMVLLWGASAARRVEHAADARLEPSRAMMRSRHRVAGVVATLVVAGNISFPSPCSWAW